MFDVYNQLTSMLEEMAELDFTTTPGFIATKNIRDQLADRYPESFANDFVAAMPINIGAASADEAMELSDLFVPAVIKFIETMLEAGFSHSNVITMAGQLSLTYE